MIIFKWLNNQLLKMEWLWKLVELLVTKVFGLSIESRLGGSVHFFIYDVIKIFILLSVLIFTISYIQSFFPPEISWGHSKYTSCFTWNGHSVLFVLIHPFVYRLYERGVTYWS